MFTTTLLTESWVAYTDKVLNFLIILQHRIFGGFKCYGTGSKNKAKIIKHKLCLFRIYILMIQSSIFFTIGIFSYDSLWVFEIDGIANCFVLSSRTKTEITEIKVKN